MDCNFFLFISLMKDLAHTFILKIKYGPKNKNVPIPMSESVYQACIFEILEEARQNPSICKIQTLSLWTEANVRTTMLYTVYTIWPYHCKLCVLLTFLDVKLLSLLMRLLYKTEGKDLQIYCKMTRNRQTRHIWCLYLKFYTRSWCGCSRPSWDCITGGSFWKKIETWKIFSWALVYPSWPCTGCGYTLDWY